MRRALTVAVLLTAAASFAQTPRFEGWTFKTSFELHANYRDSGHERFTLQTPFPPDFLPVGEEKGHLETVNAGRHAEFSFASLTLDASFRNLVQGRAKFDAIDLYNRNPTSGDKTFDTDELWLRFGTMPSGFQLPERSSIFLLMGKAPKMERQPVRLLESYGLATNSFNRFCDTQFLLGGSIGRNFYWRGQVSSGNPVFFRDSNALAGDNGIRELLQKNPDPRLKSGFPILYDAEVEGLFFHTDHPEIGAGAGYRWKSEAGTGGFDLLAYHYQRRLADTVVLNGMFYGGDLDLLDGAFGISLPIEGDQKRDSGARLFAQWKQATVVAQWVRQRVAGLDRSGYEIETGIRYRVQVGPELHGAALISSIQPAVRVSALINHFRGPGIFMDPAVWWDWVKTDAGVRIGIYDHYDLTIERSFHSIDSPRRLDLDETMVTFRVRI